MTNKSQNTTVPPAVQNPVDEPCNCGSGVPEQAIVVNGHKFTLIALPLIFKQFLDEGKPNTFNIVRELLDMVKIYNPIPNDQDEAFILVLSHEYGLFRDTAGKG